MNHKTFLASIAVGAAVGFTCVEILKEAIERNRARKANEKLARVINDTTFFLEAQLEEMKFWEMVNKETF